MLKRRQKQQKEQKQQQIQQQQQQPSSSTLLMTSQSQLMATGQQGQIINETDSEDEFDLGLFQICYQSQKRAEDEAEENKLQLPLLVNRRIPIPRNLSEYMRQTHQLGRVDVSAEQKRTFFAGGEKESKTVFNHLSLNRNLKNYMIQHYINTNYWEDTKDPITQIKYFHLHRNVSTHFIHIARIKEMLQNYLSRKDPSGQVEISNNQEQNYYTKKTIQQRLISSNSKLNLTMRTPIAFENNVSSIKDINSPKSSRNNSKLGRVITDISTSSNQKNNSESLTRVPLLPILKRNITTTSLSIDS